MLKLVVDNGQLNNNLPTCRKSCDLFDEITGQCSISQGLDVDSPYEAARCGFFMHRESMAIEENLPIHKRFSLIEEDADYLLDDEEIFHQLVGKSVLKEHYSYPSEPDFSSLRKDATWFISPCGTYGCWIVNLYKSLLSIPQDKEAAQKGWSNKVYRSPIPLHDHKSPLSIASKMAWVIDEDGYGQYAMLVNGKISQISAPKPVNWKK
ncbi:hypothetical protein D1B31_18530 [Neobacillus notoginsengisoli]|uniref:Uncharacterized protein n=1 Tax=Neobacillus notoginsengisoli TaxID=1578198 RepID=A0A417YQ03_9BACI|nr:hypothetical protein [Neobacillus notoginsengisoli]RHW36075.1 hypothetical protein D1B31_18530 [Neobacillus notoginsengisoli]